MGKAIAVAVVAVVMAFGFVLLQLAQQAPRDRQAPARPAPVLDVREDGTLYSVNLQMSQFERRLIEEEKRSERLQAELELLRGERAKLDESLVQMHDEVRRLRRQVSERPQPAPPRPVGPGSVLPPANAPAPANTPIPEAIP